LRRFTWRKSRNITTKDQRLYGTRGYQHTSVKKKIAFRASLSTTSKQHEIWNLHAHLLCSREFFLVISNLLSSQLKQFISPLAPPTLPQPIPPTTLTTTSHYAYNLPPPLSLPPTHLNVEHGVHGLMVRQTARPTATVRDAFHRLGVRAAAAAAAAVAALLLLDPRLVLGPIAPQDAVSPGWAALGVIDVVAHLTCSTR